MIANSCSVHRLFSIDLCAIENRCVYVLLCLSHSYKLNNLVSCIFEALLRASGDPNECRSDTVEGIVIVYGLGGFEIYYSLVPGTCGAKRMRSDT